LSRFLSEVQRVLRPGGCVAFADFVSRRNGALEHLLATLTASRLRPIQLDDITANIVAALAQDEARKRELLTRHVRGWFKSFAQGAYAMEGSAMRRELVAGHTVYVAAVLKKE
jgi:ubiquinone/menaquinone biosynthesis C-methylase UbiE